MIQKIAGMLAQTENTTLREYYTSRFLDSFGFDEKVAKQALEKALKEKKLKRTRSFHSEDVSFRDKNTPSSKEEHGEVKEESSQKKNKEKISLGSAPKSELYLLILALQNPNYYKTIKNSGVVEQFSHNGVIRMFEVIHEYSTQELEYFEALTQILSVYLYDPREIQKEQYPSLTYLSKEKVEVFIQDCINKVEEGRKRLNLKNITANMRLDQENAEKYLTKIVEWTKDSKSAENKI